MLPPNLWPSTLLAAALSTYRPSAYTLTLMPRMRLARTLRARVAARVVRWPPTAPGSGKQLLSRVPADATPLELV